MMKMTENNNSSAKKARVFLCRKAPIVKNGIRSISHCGCHLEKQKKAASARPTNYSP